MTAFRGEEGPRKPAVPRDPADDRAVLTETRREVRRPPKFKVVLYNDDYTPMEFVVRVLEQIFQKGPAEATELMLQIHRGGYGIAGVYVLEVAETKAVAVHQAAERNGYPLRAGVEQE